MYIVGVAAWYYTFDTVRKLLVSPYDIQYNTGSIPLWKTALSGACAGIGYWTFAYPQDLIKSIVQTQLFHNMNITNNVSIGNNTITESSTSSIQAIYNVMKQLYADGGILRFYRGYNAGLVRGIIGASTTFTTYNIVINYINTH